MTRRRWGPWQSVRRAARYHLFVPLCRSRHPPEHTARGVAAGIFWGVLPIFGLQTVAILATWSLARRTRFDLSLVQALAWQWVNNPLTTLPLYYVFYTTGHLLAGHGWSGGYNAFVALWQDTVSGTGSWTTHALNIAQVIGVPTLAGALPWAAIASAVGYGWGRRVVEARRGGSRFHTEVPDDGS